MPRGRPKKDKTEKVALGGITIPEFDPSTAISVTVAGTRETIGFMHDGNGVTITAPLGTVIHWTMVRTV